MDLRAALTAFGWRVLEIDGHDMGQIAAACEDARAAGSGSTPTMILARTQKGKGVVATEGRAEWHARAPQPAEHAAFRAELLGADDPPHRRTRRRRGGPGMSKAQREVWAETLIEIAAENPDLLVLDADLASSTQAARFETAYPDRFLQMGIAEQNMVSVAAGLSFEGFVPWLSSFGIFFSHRALDQVRMSVAQTHANVKIGAAYTGIKAGLGGKTHVDIADIAIVRALPGMTLLCPADATEVAAMTRWATAHQGPVWLRLDRESEADVFGPDYVFEPGRVLRLREGSDVLLVSTGQQTARTLAAAELLDQQGISAGVLHVPTIKPVDAGAIAAACAGVPYIVTTEEHSVIGGLGALVAEIVTAAVPRPVFRIGVEDTWIESAPNAFLLDKHGLTPERVAARVAGQVTRAIGNRPR